MIQSDTFREGNEVIKKKKRKQPVTYTEEQFALYRNGWPVGSHRQRNAMDARRHRERREEIRVFHRRYGIEDYFKLNVVQRELWVSESRRLDAAVMDLIENPFTQQRGLLGDR